MLRSKISEIIPDINLNPIESLEDLKNILVEIIETAKLELKEDSIPVAIIKKNFFAKYQFHADFVKIVKSIICSGWGFKN